MKFKITAAAISLLLVFTLVGCDNPITRFVNQVEIGNTFSDFAPGYAEILKGNRNLSSRAERSLASSVSKEMKIDDLTLEPENLTSAKIALLEAETMENEEFSIILDNINKSDFVVFLEAEDVEEVREDLQEEWIKYDNIVSQEITDVEIFHDDIDFDEAPEFNTDTVSAIRSIINVSNNTGSLEAQIAMKINGEAYEGTFKAGFVKSGDDWKINSIEINMEKK